MGFPKNLNSQTQQELYIKYSHSELCHYLNIKNMPDCNNSFKAVCSLDYLNVPYHEERFIPKTDVKNKIITLKKNDHIVSTSSTDECSKLLTDGYQYYDELKMLSKNPEFGITNILVFSLLIIVLCKKFFNYLSIIAYTKND